MPLLPRCSKIIIFNKKTPGRRVYEHARTQVSSTQTHVLELALSPIPQLLPQRRVPRDVTIFIRHANGFVILAAHHSWARRRPQMVLGALKRRHAQIWRERRREPDQEAFLAQIPAHPGVDSSGVEGCHVDLWMELCELACEVQKGEFALSVSLGVQLRTVVST